MSMNVKPTLMIVMPMQFVITRRALTHANVRMASKEMDLIAVVNIII